MKQPLVPLETDSTTLQLRIHSVPSLYLMKGKSGNLLLMNLECKKKKMPPFAENGIKLLVEGKLWLEPIQDLMKDPCRDGAGGKSYWNADCFNRMHTVSSSCTIRFIKAWPWWRAVVVWEGQCLGFMQSLWCRGLYVPYTSTDLRGRLNGARPAEKETCLWYF